MPTAHELLRDRFGMQAFRPGQEAVIKHLLAGRSVAAVFPTGGGKSLCYQLPALVFPGVTLVVSPLIALMKDQIDRLHSRGIPAERLDSTLSWEQTVAVMDGVRSGRLRLLYVAPERFNNERFRENLRRIKVSLFAVDEAHCISEWGHNFRPDYLKLAGFAKSCGAERVLALTATATPQVLADVCRGFDIAPECAVRTGFYRPNLTVLVTPVAAARRDILLRQRLRDNDRGPTIVYVTLQRTAEEVARQLADAGLPAKAYHAGLETEHRSAVQDWFAASNDAIVVATIAFGMGIDKANIRAVYHYNLPKSLENFSQEIGRAGRDGLPSRCEMFVCPDDLIPLENFVYGDTPSPDALAGLVKDVFGRSDEFSVALTQLAAEHDVRPLVLNTLLTYLELDGYLEKGTPYYATYRFRPLLPSKEILGKFEGERRQFLAAVFRQARKAKVWFDIDVDGAARATGSTRERVVSALDYLAQQKFLELTTSDAHDRFRGLKTPPSLNAVAEELHRRCLDRERKEIGRLNQVLELAGHDGCLVTRLCRHFGEPREGDCGHCSWCLDGGKAVRLLPRPTAAISDAVWKEAEEFRSQHAEVLTEPRAFARFLCGLTSPRLTKAKLTREKLFGALGAVPFPDVLRRAGG